MHIGESGKGIQSEHQTIATGAQSRKEKKKEKKPNHIVIIQHFSYFPSAT